LGRFIGAERPQSHSGTEYGAKTTISLQMVGVNGGPRDILG
jgi:hypothetical protein